MYIKTIVSKIMWEKATDLIFTGVVHLKGDSLKHFWIMDRSLCGIEAEEFRVAEDAIVTCPECKNTEGFFETNVCKGTAEVEPEIME